MTRIIFTDAVYFIRAIANAPKAYMADRAFDIMKEFEAADNATLQTISCAYTLSDEDLTSPNYCRAMAVAGEYLAIHADERAA